MLYTEGSLLQPRVHAWTWIDRAQILLTVHVMPMKYIRLHKAKVAINQRWKSDCMMACMHRLQFLLISPRSGFSQFSYDLLM